MVILIDYIGKSNSPIGDYKTFEDVKPLLDTGIPAVD